MAVRIQATDAGMLTEFGYHVNKSSRARHRILARAVRAHGKERVWHELHAGYVRSENQNPEAARVFRADRNFVQRMFGKRG